MHGEEVLTDSFFSAPITAIGQITAQTLNFWYTRNFRHTYIPSLEFTATFDQQRREIAQTTLPTYQARDPYYLGPDYWRINKRQRLNTDKL